MKKFLSVALAVVMLLATVPVFAVAESYVDKINISFVLPEVGQPAITNSVMDNTENCTLITACWVEAESGVRLENEAIFAEGEYIIEATFAATNGKTFNEGTTQVLLNGKAADTIKINPDGTLTATAKFECGKDGGDETSTFSFEKFFKGILTVLKAFVRLIGSLLGLK